MALPILRETKMTTVHIEHGTLSEQVLHQAITALECRRGASYPQIGLEIPRQRTSFGGEIPLIRRKRGVTHNFIHNLGKTSTRGLS